MNAITRDAARQYLEGWAQVEALELRELRETSIEVKARQLSALMASRHLFGEERGREEGVLGVRERWACIRRSHGG